MARKTTSVRVLLTCVGRRVELVRAFQRAGEKLGLKLEIHGADASHLTPAMQLLDHRHIVPTIASGQYLDALLEIAKKRGINLLIPTIDSELAVLAEGRDRLEEAGCRAMISSPGVIETCQDKLATFRFLQAKKIDTPRTWPWVVAMEQNRYEFPYYLKPRRGSAGKGNYIINDQDELRVLGKRVPDAIVQEFVNGEEYTLDVYAGLDGVARCVVPRKRLEVRTGEVSKGLVVKDPEIMAMGALVVNALRECRGVITVQCMITPQKRIRVIEMNARFGGGAPLAIHAGADFPKWVLQEHLGRRPRINPTGFRDGVAMLRFDDSVFVSGANRLLQRSASGGAKSKRR